MMDKKYSHLLGPVFLYWIAQLHDRLAFLADARGRKALYCTRAGKRIQDLIHAYSNGVTPFDAELFGISRVSACRVGAAFPHTFRTAHSITSASLKDVTLGDLCRSFLRHEWDDDHPQMAALARLRQSYDEANFRCLIAANDPAATFFRDRLVANHAGLERWLLEHLRTESDRRENKSYVLVDSGWQGSIQRMLSEAFPQYEFEGLYFGVLDHAPMPGRYGIIFDSPHYRHDLPETAFIIHRHLVETILEPNAPSVEELEGGPNDTKARAQLQAVREEVPDPVEDALFIGIRDYIAAHADQTPDKILIDHRRALVDLAPILITPTHEDAVALAGKNRSIDFGREGNVPVLRLKTESDTADLRIQSALWPQGQIAIEFDRTTARKLQLQVLGQQDGGSFFASHEKNTASSRAREYASGKPTEWSGSVAVVTRTKNRPLLLRRAAESVASQTWQNIQWVVVNDGGESVSVRRIIDECGMDPTRITLIDNATSVGMEAASNMGVRAVDTEFVVIHDDDDRWEPDFLKESIEFLQAPRASAADFEGVVSRSFRVSEQIDGHHVIIHNSKPFMPWVTEVSLAQMAVGNFFAPISFLYRRWVYDEIGGYDERLPVLGDWRFNLDFLMQANIGFLDRYLSFYHHRDIDSSTGAGVYANSVVGARKLHEQYFSVVTNRIMRDPSTPEGLRQVIANAHQQRVMEQNFHNMRELVDRLENQLNQHISGTEGTREAPMKRFSPEIAASVPSFSKDDVDHIRNSLRRELPLTGSLRQIAARLWYEIGLAQLHNPDRRRFWLPRMFHLIPSPEHFDHIAYLRAHPEIWATPFNGRNEWLPYHHHLLDKC